MGYFFRYGWGAVTLRVGVLSTIFVSLAACEETEGAPLPGYGNAVDRKFEELVLTFEHERVTSAVPGAAIAILQNGKLTFARGFGSKNPIFDDPVDPDTLFRIGSITKTLTAATIAQNIEDGRIELDNPITEVLSGFSFAQNGDWAKSVSTRHLLTHSSGIVDNMALSTAAQSREDQALKEYAYHEFAERSYLMAKAGEFYNYSNPNYMLLGLMAETVSKRDYPSLVTEAILEPLNMNRTVFRASNVREDGNFALASTTSDTNLSKPNTQLIEPENLDDAWVRPAGGAWSSVVDMANLGRFLLSGNERVLGHHQWLTMVSPQVDTHEEGDLKDYGFGVTITQGLKLGPDEYYDLQSRSHSGLTPGYSANLSCFKVLDFCIITLASAENAYFPRSVAAALRTLTELPKPSLQPNVAVDVTRYGAYSGNYVDRYNWGDIEVTTSDNRLWVKLPTFDAQNIAYEKELSPLYSDSFLMTIDGYSFPITFIAGSSGRYKYFRSRHAVGIRTFSANEGWAITTTH